MVKVVESRYTYTRYLLNRYCAAYSRAMWRHVVSLYTEQCDLFVVRSMIRRRIFRALYSTHVYYVPVALYLVGNVDYTCAVCVTQASMCK